MIGYINEVVLPYVSRQRDSFGEAKPAVIIMDNFKGQITNSVLVLLEENDIQVCLLPPNTTDRLQPLDVSVNKPAKDFLQRKFEEWFTDEIIKQLDGQDLDTSDLDPIDLSSAVVKEKSARWLVELADYMAANPQIIVNGFMRTGITGALDGIQDDDSMDTNEDSEDEAAFEEYTEEFEYIEESE